MRKAGATLLLLFLSLACRPDNVASGPALEEIARVETFGFAHDVAVEPDRVIVADRKTGICVISRDTWTTSRRLSTVKDPISLVLYGGGALAATGSDGLVLTSLGDELLGQFKNGDIANAVDMRGDLAFAAQGLSGLTVSRIASDGIHAVAQLRTPGWSHDVVVWRNLALLADWKYGLRIVDIREPEQPKQVGVLPTETTTIAVATKGSEPLAALAEGQGGVALVDLSDTARPRLLARHSLGLKPTDPTHPKTGGWAHGVAWSGRYVFVANWKSGVTVLDVQDIGNPRIVAESPTHGTALSVSVEPAPDGTLWAFVADGETGLRVLRFRD